MGDDENLAKTAVLAGQVFLYPSAGQVGNLGLLAFVGDQNVDSSRFGKVGVYQYLFA